MRHIVVLDSARKWGGGTSSLLALLKGLQGGRYSFRAVFYDNFSFGTQSDIQTELQKIQVEFVALGRFRPSLGIKLLKETIRVGLCFSRPWRARAIFSLDYQTRILPDAVRLADVLRREHADLVYLNNQPSENLDGILAARAAGIPVVQHARSSVRIRPLEASLTNSHVHRVVCVSQGARDALVSSGVRPELCQVVYNGVDPAWKPDGSPELARRDLGLHSRDLVIGTVGFLMPGKRVHLLFEAFANISRRIPNAKCVVVGAGPEFSGLQDAARKLGISDHVVFTGFREDALACLGAMDIFVLPSKSEGLPRAVLEAMMLSKPVVAFNVPGVRELVVDGTTGFLVHEGDVAGLSSRLEVLAGSRTLRDEMGREAKTRVEQFSLKNYLAGVSAVFDQVLR